MKADKAARSSTCSTCGTACRTSWYVWAYTRLLPLAYKLLAREDSAG